MEILIITGLSGAGKTRASNVLEDIDWYCVDNLPIELMTKFAEFCISGGASYEKVALVTDVREKSSLRKLPGVIQQLRAMNCTCRILFMVAETDTLVKRYKESRRPHPLARSGESIEAAVKREAEQLESVRAEADFVFDSTGLTLGQLQSQLFELFAGEDRKRAISVTVESFGYKHGIPLDADLVFDVRFLPNPFYIEELKHKTGLDRPVAEYVFQHKQSRELMEHLEAMMDFLLPLYVEEGKHTLTVAIGCTGGHHRSVAVAAALNAYLKAKGVDSININRDIEK